MLSVNSPDRDVAIAPDGRHLVYQEGNIGAAQVFRARASINSSPCRCAARPT